MSESKIPPEIPAQLSFLTIYNPVLGGKTDESLSDQIVFYTSQITRQRRTQAKERRLAKGEGGDHNDNDDYNENGHDNENNDNDNREEDVINEKNRRLRQIGLAEGMVNLARLEFFFFFFFFAVALLHV